MTLTLIHILSGDPRGRTPLGVDGRFVELPHDRAVPVDAAQLHALGNSNIRFEIVNGAHASAPGPSIAGRREIDAFLDRPIRAMDFAALDRAELDALAAAEGARARPRASLLARLNRRRNADRAPGDRP